jgi:hypothetical protein
VSVTSLISAVTKTPEQMAQIMATKESWEPRGNTCHQALEAMVNNRWNPSPPSATACSAGDYNDWIEPMLNSPLWERITVIGSEVMAYSMAYNVAGTVDLVLQFADGTHGIADLKTQGSKSAKPYDTKPQLGAGVDMIGQHYRLVFSRCLTLWSRPGSFEIQTHDAQECLDAWLDVVAQYKLRFRPW